MSANWKLAAHGLMRPSPFYDRDERERRRREQIDEILGPLDGKEKKLLERCMRDAYDAQVPPTGPADVRRVERKHPLSGKSLGKSLGSKEIDDWFAREEGRLEKIKLIVSAGGDLDAAAYRRIWWAMMDDDTSMMPGSLLLPDHGVSAHRQLTAALMRARTWGRTMDGEVALLYVHLGPVQGFIQAARRTHDLWVGSYTVAYLTLRAACAVAGEYGPDALVYPDLIHLEAAKPLLFEGDSRIDGRLKEEIETEDSDELAKRLRSSLANKLMIVVARDKAKAAFEAALTAAHEAWATMAEAARCEVNEAIRDAVDKARSKSENSRLHGVDPWRGAQVPDLFKEQIQDHLEIDGVIQPWPENLDELRERLEQFGLFEGHVRTILRQTDRERMGVGYGPLYDLTHRAMAAHRQALIPGSLPGDQRPKCTQCGAREQMGPLENSPHRQLRESRAYFEALSKALREYDGDDERMSFQITRGEGLCAVCLTKRFATEKFYGNEDDTGAGLGLSWKKWEHRKLLRFPSTYTLAAAPFLYWLADAVVADAGPGSDGDRALRDAVEGWLDKMARLLANDCLHFTPPGNLLPGLRAVERRLPERYRKILSHEGLWAYEESYVPLTAWRNHYPDEPDKGSETYNIYKNVQEKIVPARRAYHAMRTPLRVGPSLYYAVLVLDGDEMGKWLTGRHDKTPTLGDIATAEVANPMMPRPLFAALHGEIARRMSALSARLHDVVEGYLGRVVYSGGDDLLALLPLQTALACARDVERAFRESEYLDDKVTVSAGLSIAHARTPLGRALEVARKAESDAKKAGRDRLRVRVLIRSGGPLAVTLPWRLRHVSNEPSTIDVLLDLMAGKVEGERDDDGQPLLRVDVAHQLEREVDVLECVSREAFRTRVRTLLRAKKLEPGKHSRLDPRQALEALLDERSGLAPREFVHLLQLLRFLRREEHGIDTQELLIKLGSKEGA